MTGKAKLSVTQALKRSHSKVREGLEGQVLIAISGNTCI